MKSGPHFELTAHLTQSVSAGIGFGLIPEILVQDELHGGELVALFEPIENGRCYYLVCATRYQNLRPLNVFSESPQALSFLIHKRSAPIGAIKKGPSRGPVFSSAASYLVSQDSTVAEPCSAFHSFRVLWLPPLVSTTSPVLGCL
ncbi:type 2 periplasmic-binding domain-containing protein [Pseudomonas sp. TMB3-21]